MRTVPILTGAAVLLVLAGCGSSSKSPTTSTTSAPSSSGSSVPGTATAGAPLSKADFITQMNKECKAVNDRVNALPQPSGPTDFAVVITNLTGTVKEFPGYLTTVDELVNQSPDAAELQQKWVGPERTELGNFSTAAAKVVADAKAKDAAKIQTDIAGLDAANSSSAAIGTYLTSYGLTDCASLETN